MRNPDWLRDEIILALDLYFDPERGPIEIDNPKIVALSQLLRGLPLFKKRPNKKTFRNTNGVKLKLSNFKAIDPLYKGKGMGAYSTLDKVVFEEFSTNIPLLRVVAEQIKQAASDPEIVRAIYAVEDDELSETDSVMEGQVLYKLHKTRERNTKLVAQKKKQVLAKTGALKCEACDFDFSKFYGALGEGFIECHHLVPLSSYRLNNRTQLKDLALLCSNCHRMIHRNLSATSIEKFRALWR